MDSSRCAAPKPFMLDTLVREGFSLMGGLFPSPLGAISGFYVALGCEFAACLHPSRGGRGLPNSCATAFCEYIGPSLALGPSPR